MLRGPERTQLRTDRRAHLVAPGRARHRRVRLFVTVEGEQCGRTGRADQRQHRLGTTRRGHGLGRDRRAGSAKKGCGLVLLRGRHGGGPSVDQRDHGDHGCDVLPAAGHLEDVTAGQGASPEDDPLRVHAGLGGRGGDRGPVVLLLAGGGDDLAWPTVRAAESAVVKGEGGVPGGGERLGERHQTRVDRASQPVGQHDAGSPVEGGGGRVVGLPARVVGLTGRADSGQEPPAAVRGLAACSGTERDVDWAAHSVLPDSGAGAAAGDAAESGAAVVAVAVSAARPASTAGSGRP